MPDAARPGVGPLGITTVELRLRRLSAPDLQTAHRGRGAAAGAASADWRRTVLLELAAMIALGASGAAYTAVLGDGVADAPPVESVLGMLVAVAPVVGLARLVSAAPILGLALGYDVDAALERHDAVEAVACEGRELLLRAIGPGSPP